MVSHTLKILQQMYVPDHFETLWIKELKSFNLYVLTVNSHTHIVIASLASAQYMQQFTQVDSTLF